MSTQDSALPSKIKSGKKRKRTSKRITANYLHNAGLYYLQRFASSKAHFRAVMLRKVKRSCLHHHDQSYEDCAKLVDELADTFERTGLLDDDAYIRGMVSSLRRRGLSQKYIVEKMRVKGIEREKTLLYLDRHDQEFAEGGQQAERRAALTFCRRKKIGPFANHTKILSEEQLTGKLARAGFSYDTVRFVLEIEKKEAEVIISGVV